MKHPFDNDLGPAVYQPSIGNSQSRQVGHTVDAASRYDTMLATTGEYINSGRTAATAQPDISGTWSFIGIADVTSSGDTVNCSTSGERTCNEVNEANHAERDGNSVDKEVDMRDQAGLRGDSGAPYVDPDGKLVCMYTSIFDGCTSNWDQGVAGYPAFDSVGFQLRQP